uniref:3',5'-cyclic-GMP phosphodiesterase n=1 Tax=Poecilia latipinna TaxID=48699 RepID=A0A3B3TSC9_9TELE
NHENTQFKENREEVRVPGETPVTPVRKPSPAELKQKDSRQFKTSSQRSFRGLDDAAVICPWEEFGDVELSDLAQFGTA